MRIVWKFVVAGVLCGAAAATTGILAQVPERTKGAQPAQPKREPGERRSGELAAKADPAVEAWVKVLLEKVTDPHDTVRDSARAGLVAVGHPALLALQKLADGDDGAKATAARKLIGEIHAREQRQGGGFGGPGFPGGGFPDGRPPIGNGQPGGNGPARPNPFIRPPDAGGQPSSAGGPLAGIERILPELKLGDKELKQVKELFEKAKKQTQEIFAEAREKNAGREEIGKEMEKVHAEIFKGLKLILTEEQFQKIEKAMAGRQTGQPKEPGPGGRPTRPPGERPPE